MQPTRLDVVKHCIIEGLTFQYSRWTQTQWHLSLNADNNRSGPRKNWYMQLMKPHLSSILMTFITTSSSSCLRSSWPLSQLFLSCLTLGVPHLLAPPSVTIRELFFLTIATSVYIRLCITLTPTFRNRPTNSTPSSQLIRTCTRGYYCTFWLARKLQA